MPRQGVVIRSRPVDHHLVEREYLTMRAVASNERERLLLDTLWETGARMSELLGIGRGQVRDGFVILHTAKQREGQQLVRRLRELAVPDELSARLLMAIDSDPFGRAFAYSYWTGWRIFHRCADAAGVNRPSGRGGVYRPVWPHLARHGFAMRLREACGQIDVVQQALGHRNLASTQIYARPSAGRLEAALREMRQGTSARDTDGQEQTP